MWGAALLAPAACAQALSGWMVETELHLLRLSTVLDGDVLEDEASPIRSSSDRVTSWARQTAQAAAEREVDGEIVRWSVFTDNQVHVRGTGGQAAVRLNGGASGVQGQNYPFDVDAVKHRRHGVAVSHSANATWWGQAVRWSVGASVFAVDRFKALDAQGVLQDQAGGRLGLQAQLHEREMGRSTTFVRPDKALGWGAALDMSLSGGRTDGLSWRVAVRDWGPSVRLSHLLITDRTADTNTRSFDGQGYVQFAPAIQGRYSIGSARMRLEPEWSTQVRMSHNERSHTSASLLWHGQRQEVGLTQGWVLGSQTLAVGAHLNRGVPASLSVGWSAPWGMVSWRGDAFHPGKAKVWGLTGSVRF